MDVVKSGGCTSSGRAAVAGGPESPTVTTLVGPAACMVTCDLSSEWHELESGLLHSVWMGTTAQMPDPRSSKGLSAINAAKSVLLDKLVLTRDMIPGESGSDISSSDMLVSLSVWNAASSVVLFQTRKFLPLYWNPLGLRLH